MKKGLALIALCCTTFYNFAQTVAFSDDFESGLGNWTIQIEDTSHVNSTVSEFAPGWIIVQDTGSNHAAGATSYFTVPGQANRWMISPAISLGAFGNILSWQARSYDPSYPDGYRIFVSNTTNDISSFTDTISNILQEYEDWTTRTYNLSDSGYVNETIYLAFIIDSYDKFKLYFDNIKVVIDDPAGVAENNKIEWALYPNPTTTTIHISSADEIKDYRIISLTGEILKSDKLYGNQIDVSALNAGTYFLEIRDLNNAVDRKRFVVR